MIPVADQRLALEVGQRVAGPVRIAFEVAEASAATSASIQAGATLIAEPVLSPWDSLNSRLESPGGQQLTLFSG